MATQLQGITSFTVEDRDGPVDLATTISARLGTVPAEREVSLTVTDVPREPAPRPPHPAGDVISVFSDAFNDRPVHTFGSFGNGGVVVGTREHISQIELSRTATTAFVDNIYFRR